MLTTGCWAQELYFNVVSGAAGPTSLTVVSVSPANGATNVGRDQPVSVTFSNSINNSTTGGTNTQLYAGQDLQTNGSVTISADGRTLTFNIGALSNGTTYTVAIPAGGLSDQWGNTLASPFTSTFTTIADPATGNGGVQAVAPASGATGVPTDTLLTLYMNRQVDAATLPGQLNVTVNGQVYAGNVQATASNYEIQFTPSVAFPNGATVQWFLSGSLLDVNGDAFTSNTGSFYTVATANPAAAPVNQNNSPGSGTSNIATNADIYMQFSLPLNNATLISSNVYLYDGSNGTYPAITITQPEPGVIGIAPNSPLNASSNYDACANSNVKGTNGVATTSGCYDTYFTTGTAPGTTTGTVTIGPPNGSVNVGTNAYIRLEFSKPFNRAMFNSANIQVTTGGNPIPGVRSFNYRSGTNDAIGANFSPTNPLPPSSVIDVSASGVPDYAGNTFGSTSSSFTTAALPDYSTPTVMLDLGGKGSATYGIGTNASFTCLYSEPMDPSSATASNTYVYSYVIDASIPVNYTWASDLMSVTMTPITPLFADTEYYYQCYNAIDLTGNTTHLASTEAINMC
ncbi:MAG: Ig-like domain-containing protein [Acidobacteriaceae bacterium]